MNNPLNLNLSVGQLLGLFVSMTVLAALPSISVLAVTATSVSSGFVQGVWTVIGIVIGDVLFILTAVFGLVLLLGTWVGAFGLIKYGGAAYLIWLAVYLWRSRPPSQQPQQNKATSWLSSLITGLTLTGSEPLRSNTSD